MARFPHQLDNTAGRRASIKPGTVGSWLWSALRLAEVRLRIPIVLVVAALVIGRWDFIRNYWGRFTRSATAENAFKMHTSADTEYFCPMDPGVVSHGPARCGVCNMVLVRRKRGEAVMLPNGVVARMQLSPYRIQLAGIRTAPLGYLALKREWSGTGLIARDGKGDAGATITVEVPGRSAPWVKEGERVDVRCVDLPGQAPIEGRVRSLARGVDQGREFARAVVAIETPPPLLQGGMVATVAFRIAAAELDPFRAMPSDPPARKRGETARIFICHDHPETIAIKEGRCPLDGKPRMAQSLGALERLQWWCPMHPEVTAEKPGGVCERCGGMALQPKLVFFAPKGQVLAVPQSAIVDTGARQVVFVEAMPGMFDAVEVVLGPRCGDFYPVARGLAPGQAVALAGAFLLDAETRLNPSLAASYFGAGRGDRAAPAANALEPVKAANASDASGDPFQGLDPSMRALAERQATCPVTGRPLGSMGAPQRVDISGRTVFLCCEGCEARLRREPAKYLAKLPAQSRP
jgi:membrane fusion protein, copper/silver efflux system